MNDLLTTKDVQDLLHVDRTTIYRMVQAGELPAVRVGKLWRFPRLEIERWLGRNPRQRAAASGPDAPVLAGASLRDLMPVDCAQAIQDAFADLLGIMLVVTDMQGQPLTQVSNPCGFFLALTGSNPAAIRHCVQGWQQLAGLPALEPRFARSETGLLCARGLIRSGSALSGMVVAGGIAPEPWPPPAGELAELAERFGADSARVTASADAVHLLDQAGRERALRYVQRIADIFSHILDDRNQVHGRLQAIASLTTL